MTKYVKLLTSDDLFYIIDTKFIVDREDDNLLKRFLSSKLDENDENKDIIDYKSDYTFSQLSIIYKIYTNQDIGIITEEDKIIMDFFNIKENKRVVYELLFISTYVDGKKTFLKYLSKNMSDCNKKIREIMIEKIICLYNKGYCNVLPDTYFFILKYKNISWNEKIDINQLSIKHSLDFLNEHDRSYKHSYDITEHVI